MARLPARVDWIEHKRTGVKVPLRLNKKKMTFRADYGGQTFRSKDGAEVRAKVLKAIEESHKMTFQPVIRVEIAKGAGSSYFGRADSQAGVALSMMRFHFSQEGALRQISWEDHERNNMGELKQWRLSGYKGTAEDFTLPYRDPRRRSYSNDRFYLPYSEEVWQGLQRIIDLIDAAKERLDAFLTDPGVVAKLVAIGTGAVYPLLEGGDLERIAKGSEMRKCNECGEEWQDTGDLDCIFCGSPDTKIIDEEEA